jgi:hypothetical protein
VSVREYSGQSLFKVSGMIVSPCFVLTSGNCVYNFSTNDFYALDSIQIIPAFNNGQAQTGLPRCGIKKIYMFKRFFDQSEWHDIALLELDVPIGIITGWTGIGFDSSPNFTNGKVYHKFSYPSGANPSDTSKIYNGDTLYYNYGNIVTGFTELSVPSNAAWAIPGQGGSTFMFSNNIDYYSVGLSSYSNSYYHYKITSSAFYNLANVLASQSCDLNYYTSLNEYREETIGMKLVPNPSDMVSVLHFNYDPSEQYSLNILNILGQPACNSIPVNSGTITIRENLAPGIYMVQLLTRKGASYTQRMIRE